MTRRCIELPIQAIEEYDTGATSADLAEKYGHQQSSILRWLRRNNVVMRAARAPTKPETTELRNAVVKEWNKCALTLTGVGAKFGIPRTAVGRLLAEARKSGVHVYKPSPAVVFARNSAKQRGTRPFRYDVPSVMPELLARGIRINGIAVRFGVGWHTARKWVRQVSA